jgi:hypothetical protein
MSSANLEPKTVNGEPGTYIVSILQPRTVTPEPLNQYRFNPSTQNGER